MCEAHVCDTKLDNPLWFRLFIAEINGREKMRKALYKHRAALSYAGNTLLVLSDSRIIVSFR